jgi:hypothetical protein
VAAGREARQAKDRADLKQRGEAANEQAARVPLETATLSLRALRELERLAPTLNKNLSSDVLVAVNALLTAVRGGVLNVRVNLPSVGAAAAEELAGGGDTSAGRDRGDRLPHARGLSTNPEQRGNFSQNQIAPAKAGLK